MKSYQFVKYKVVDELLKLGFNDGCMAVVWPDEQVYEGGYSFCDIMIHRDKSCIKAPLYQQAFDWFSDNYGINLLITQNVDKSYSFITQSINPLYNKKGIANIGYYEKKHQAKNAGVWLMIELIKNK